MDSFHYNPFWINNSFTPVNVCNNLITFARGGQFTSYAAFPLVPQMRPNMRFIWRSRQIDAIYGTDQRADGGSQSFGTFSIFTLIIQFM